MQEALRPQPARTAAELRAALAEVERKLEAANTIENPIERTWKREQFIERQDELEAELVELLNA